MKLHQLRRDPVKDASGNTRRLSRPLDGREGKLVVW